MSVRIKLRKRKTKNSFIRRIHFAGPGVSGPARNRSSLLLKEIPLQQQQHTFLGGVSVRENSNTKIQIKFSKAFHLFFFFFHRLSHSLISFPFYSRLPSFRAVTHIYFLIHITTLWRRWRRWRLTSVISHPCTLFTIPIAYLVRLCPRISFRQSRARITGSIFFVVLSFLLRRAKNPIYNSHTHIARITYVHNFIA